MATTYFKATFANGDVETRSTQARAYAFCYRQNRWPYKGWTSRADLVPAGAEAAQAVQITAEEYRAILKGKEVARMGGDEHALKLRKAHQKLARAQADQRSRGAWMLEIQIALLARNERFIRNWGGGAGVSGEPDLAKCEATCRERMVGYQQDQANAYKRIAQAMREIAKLEVLV